MSLLLNKALRDLDLGPAELWVELQLPPETTTDQFVERALVMLARAASDCGEPLLQGQLDRQVVALAELVADMQRDEAFLKSKGFSSPRPDRHGGGGVLGSRSAGRGDSHGAGRP